MFQNLSSAQFLARTIDGIAGVNVFKLQLQTTLWALLEAGPTQRQIERYTGISRNTIRAYKKKLDSQKSAPPAS